MPLLAILLVIAAVLYGVECVFGVPGLTQVGMAVVLVLLGCIIGVCNWCILINNLRRKKYVSFIPLIATFCFMGAGSLADEQQGIIILLAVGIDPWPAAMLIGLLMWPFRLLCRVRKQPGN